MDDATFQQSIPHQVEHGLQMFAALDNPVRQGLSALENQRLQIFDNGLTAGKVEVVPNAPFPKSIGSLSVFLFCKSV
ncbi:MAG: hypothetical protein ACN6Q5_20895 [Pseudomonas sp.]|uniref:hypothetical protein n=1 Tax=Pseudomonas sp. TaxID=306 RepID=UPI003D0AE9ED